MHTKTCPPTDWSSRGVALHGIVVWQPMPFGLNHDATVGPGLSAAGWASAEASAQGASAGMNVSIEAEVSGGPHLGGSGEPEGQVPCSDPRGCPDLFVDAYYLLFGGQVTETFAADSCNVAEGSTQAGTRRLLRFTFQTPNFGDGDLIIGDPDDNPEWFQWGACHGHWHFREYADYRLWTVEGYEQWRLARAVRPGMTPEDVLADEPALRDHFVAGHKQGFCAIDMSQYVMTAPGHYFHCGSQGISVWWADQYDASLDGQFIDITDVPPGRYILEAEVNPERLLREKDYDNNSGAIQVEVS